MYISWSTLKMQLKDNVLNKGEVFAVWPDCFGILLFIKNRIALLEL